MSKQHTAKKRYHPSQSKNHPAIKVHLLTRLLGELASHSHNLRLLLFGWAMEFFAWFFSRLGLTLFGYGILWSLAGIYALLLVAQTHSPFMINATGAVMVTGQIILFARATRQGLQQAFHSRR